MTKYIEVRAVKTFQGKDIPTYTFFLKGADVLRIADVSRIHRDATGELKGFHVMTLRWHEQLSWS